MPYAEAIERVVGSVVEDSRSALLQAIEMGK